MHDVDRMQVLHTLRDVDGRVQGGRVLDLRLVSAATIGAALVEGALQSRGVKMCVCVDEQA